MVCYIVKVTYFLFVIVLPHYCYMLKLHIIILHDPIAYDLLDLQTKGKFAYPLCGSKMKSHYSRSLGK